jgi:diguanylate cyclase (GGDEF)-like protein
MRRLALLGLVVSLLLCAVAVSVTEDNLRAGRNEQDRSLQAATGSEIGLISGGVRQTATALSLMLVNPAVREVLSGRPLPLSVRRGDLANSALTLAEIQRSAFVHLSAACLDDGTGRQLVCAPAERASTFPSRLGRQFIALAVNSAVGAASGLFLSPANGQLSVAFLAPFRVRGHLRGLVHLDISLADTHASSLVRNETPGVNVQLASYENGQLSLNSTPGAVSGSGAGSAGTLAISSSQIGPHPRSTFDAGHRAMVATLPLTIGGAHQHVAVLATALSSNPDFFGAWSPGMLTVLVLAFGTLALSVAGLIVSNRALAHELSTDPLTGLFNRRALMEDLPRTCQGASEEQPAFLWYFDLNGFKHYNDSFGHIAGDTLLARLGGRLCEAVRPHGVAYRLGGDEFCVLIAASLEEPQALFYRARGALAEQGGAFAITASAGAVEIPREASDPTQALRLADQRMYQEKGSGQTGAAELITTALHAALAQRHPDLGEHADDVVGNVEMLARSLGLHEDEIDIIVKAADLHDIGKLGIPQEIINKPGPLTAQEWIFIKQHTVMGEQLIAAAGPSLERVGPLVRASHERWDGMGYPDGVAGEEIPLGARIIAICDSFSAMLADRVYKAGMPAGRALAELHLCAGSQFDPRLVDIFDRALAERDARERIGNSAA